MNNVLADNEARVAAFGRGNPLELADRPAAAKTGTTNDFRDNWTMGYVPGLAVGVWVGNADNTPMHVGHRPHRRRAYLARADELRRADAGAAAAGLERAAQHRHRRRVRALRPAAHRLLPPDPEEIFAQGTEPTAPDNIWLPVAINRETGKRATACTPPEQVEQHFYEILPPEAADWVRAAGLPQPPTEYDAFAGTCLATGDASITQPQPFAYVHGTVDIIGTAKGENFAFFRVQGGQGLFPQVVDPD